MKALKMVKKIIIGIIGIIFFAFAIVVTFLVLNFNEKGVTEFDSTALVIIKEDIASDNYKKGDLVIIKKKKAANIKAGEEIFVYHIDKERKVHINVGKVGEIYEKEEGISFENGNTYTREFIIGEANNVYSSIGTYLAAVESKWGFLFVILVPNFLIFIYQLYSLVVEIKYGED